MNEYVNILSDFVLFAAMPWCVWVTASLFDHRAELRLIKQYIKMQDQGDE